MANLNETVSAERVHISFFGRRNAGKSSLVNALAGQEVSIVSDVKGTTTDPVKKAMELLPLGPVLLTDTPGYDDEGGLGELRVQKTRETLARTDIAVLVADATMGLTDADRELLKLFEERKLPYLIVCNKSDLTDGDAAAVKDSLTVSAKTGEGVAALKERLGSFAETLKTDKKILADLVKPGDTVILVIPIDGAAPKGRIILPQQQTLRELLDLHCPALCCQPEELPGVLANLKTPPALVVTDSQVFGKVDADCRGLHPPPPVRGYRHGKAAPLDRRVLRRETGVFLHLRRGLSAGPVPLPADRPLRRLHAERGGNAGPPAPGG